MEILLGQAIGRLKETQGSLAQKEEEIARLKQELSKATLGQA